MTNKTTIKTAAGINRKELEILSRGAVSKKREKQYVTAQAKAMALVLTIAFVVAAIATLLVSSLAESYSEAHRSASSVVVIHETSTTAANSEN